MANINDCPISDGAISYVKLSIFIRRLTVGFSYYSTHKKNKKKIRECKKEYIVLEVKLWIGVQI